MFWGFSEALDLLEQFRGNAKKDKDKKEINVLLFGANDVRHVIKTMAKHYTHRGEDGEVPFINFYLIDGCVELVARNMALLAIALECPATMSLRHKVHLFMDVYGNSLIRASSHQYLMGKVKTLLKLITDDECRSALAPLINIEGLKYRERDGLENAFNFWLPKETHIFQIQQYWSNRVRHLLGTRYDYREGQFDWDINMVLKDRGAGQLCSQEYRYWRECGIAFTFPEYEYSKPNKTLAAGLERNGNTYKHRGYIGDIQTGPFISFGLTTTDAGMLKSVHGENDYRATDITERNLLELFHELATQSPYQHDAKQSRKYGAIRLQMGKRLESSENDTEYAQNYNEPWLKVEGVRINFLSVDDVFNVQESAVWKERFDMAFVSHNYFALLKDTFPHCLRPGAVVFIETKLMTTERDPVVTSFEEKVLGYATSAALDLGLNYKALNAKHAIIKLRKPFADEKL